LDLGTWVQNKGLDPQTLYTKEFLSHICYLLTRIHNKSLKERTEKEYFNWFSDHSSCPFWNFQSWELDFYWCRELTIDRNLTTASYLKWIQKAKEILEFHLPGVLVTLCLDFFRALKCLE
jgi:hypothetical protein